MRAGAYDVVLFDLGGVLVDFGGVEPMKQLSGIVDDDTLWQRWLECTWVRRFERGHCTAEEFARGVVADWKLAIAPDAYLAAFRSWPRGPLAGAHDLVRDVRERMPVGCLSNTNALHWADHAHRWLDVFDHRFLSFELGCVKPDRELFDRVAEVLATEPGRVLFVDDNVINVEGARAAGFGAIRALGVEQTRRALVDAGVLTP